MDANKPNIDLSGAQQMLNNRMGDISDIVQSKEGQTVKSMMEQDRKKLQEAMQKGDTAALKQTFEKLMATQEGATLIGNLKEMLDNR